mgnify:CR=1 FL=1
MQFSKETTFNIWYVVAAVFGVLLIQHFWIESQRVEPIPYSEFERYLDDGKINNIVVGNQFIRGYFKEPRDGRTQFVTTRVDPALAQKLAEKGVRFTGAVESTLLRDILSWVLPILLFFGLWMFVFRRVAEKQGLGNFLPIGKSKAKVYVEKDIKVTFNDVAGVDEAKEELKEVVAFLRAPQEYGRLGARIPKGVLLVGPPGTGKTHLAVGLANAAVHAGYRTYVTTAADLAARCHKAAIEGRWSTTMRFFAGPTLLVIDELGYLPLPAEAASALFQVVAQRYLKTSIVITTNRSVAEWGDVLGDTTVAAAMLDRLLHRSVVLKLDGDSYRLRDHHARSHNQRTATQPSRRPLQ